MVSSVQAGQALPPQRYQLRCTLTFGDIYA